MFSQKKKVAVLFGGPSLEHDVSILTGLQVCDAIDTTQYTPLPIYIDQTGEMWTGSELRNRKNYHLSPHMKKKLTRVGLQIGNVFESQPYFNILSKTLLSKNKTLEFDVAFLAFHGEFGEEGRLQGVFETAQIPYAGPRLLDAAVFMNKALTKAVCREAGIPVLPEILIKKPHHTQLMDIDKIFKDIKVSFPVCLKPCHLGSTIGVHKVDSLGELHAALLAIFKIDTEVLIEPFVENLIEYNVAVTKAFGKTTHSAIERPTRHNAVLNFADKYLSQGSIDNKLSMPFSQGMASLAREMNPKSLTEAQKKIILESARSVFEIMGGCGAPRIDFLCNEQTGEIWLNEVNPIPGSLAYYLWEASHPPIHFTKLLSALIEEAFLEHCRTTQKNSDLKAARASIFPQRS